MRRRVPERSQDPRLLVVLVLLALLLMLLASRLGFGRCCLLLLLRQLELGRSEQTGLFCPLERGRAFQFWRAEELLHAAGANGDE